MDPKYVTAAKPKVEGAIFRAPLGTTVPTDATTDLSDAYKELGFISEDGPSNDMSESSEDWKAWGGEIVGSATSEVNDKWKYKLIETLNVEVLKTVYGDDNVTGDLQSGIHVKKNAKEKAAGIYIIDMLLRDNAVKRVVIPNGKITEIGEVTYGSNDPTGYEVTITGYRDENGDTHHEYIVAASEESES